MYCSSVARLIGESWPDSVADLIVSAKDLSVRDALASAASLGINGASCMIDVAISLLKIWPVLWPFHILIKCLILIALNFK